MNKPRVPECIDKNASGLNSFISSLTVYVSDSENANGPGSVCFVYGSCSLPFIK